MNRTADLDAALGFVTIRVIEQAAVSGEPLNVQQRLLLTNLPSSTPAIWIPAPEFPEPPLVPRDVNYERLCALAKAAYVNDHKINPELLDWEFAFAVFRLNRHPMWGVLHSAGVKMYRRPLWDQFFAIIAALFPADWRDTRIERIPDPFQWAEILCGTVAFMLLIYFGSRQIEQWQLENHIERCRLASRNIGWKPS